MATRRERVILDLEDHLSGGMLKAAGATGLLNRELGTLSRDSVRTRRSVSDIDQPTQKLGRSAASTSREVDKLSGRMRIIADIAAILGPALVPIGAVAVPAITGLATELGFAAVAGGTAVIAFQGVGNALKAMNTASLEPTEENLRAARIALKDLSPAARQFAREIHSLIPEARQLRDVAASGLFPGVVEGLESMDRILPRVERILAAVSTELGHIAADTGESLASERWAPFLDFIADEAPSALADMADAAGNTAHAVAELLMAADPLNDDFSGWLVNATEDLDNFASGVTKTQGYAEFIAYVEQNGPQVAATLGAIADAAVQIVQATAPLGGPVLKGIEALANVIATVADSDLGTPIFAGAAALALFNRALAITGRETVTLRTLPTAFDGIGASMKRTSLTAQTLRADAGIIGSTFLTAGARSTRETERLNGALKRTRGALAPVGKGAALIGGLGVAATGAADAVGLTNTASLALMGTMGGPLGAALGATAGLAIDLTHANDGLEDAITRVNVAARSGDLVAYYRAVGDIKRELSDLNNVSGVGDFFGDLGRQLGNPLNTLFGTNDPRDKARDALSAAEKDLAAAQKRNGAIEATREATAATSDYVGVFTKAGDVIATTHAELDGLVQAMRDQRQAALSAFDAETQWREALKAAGKQAKESNAGIKGSSDAAIKNREVISQLAAAWNNQSDAVKNNRARFREAKSAFIETATAMGVPEEAARRLAKRLLEIPKQRVIDVDLNANPALTAIARIKRELANIPPSVRTDYYVNQVNSANKGHYAPGAAGQADGGTVAGPRYPYGDKVLTMLAPGEEVITNRHGEADRFRADRAAGRIPAYADGGRVGRSGATASGPAIDYDRLAASLAGNQLLAQRMGRDMMEAAFTSALQKTPILRAPADLAGLAGMVG